MTGKPICSALGAKLPTQSSCFVLQAASNWPLVSLVSLKSNWSCCCELPYLVKFPVICQSSWPLDDSATSQKGNAWQEDHDGGKGLTAGRSNTVIVAEEEEQVRKHGLAYLKTACTAQEATNAPGDCGLGFSQVRAVTKATGVMLWISYSLRWELLYPYLRVFLQYPLRLCFRKSLARLNNKLHFAAAPVNWNKT